MSNNGSGKAIHSHYDMHATFKTNVILTNSLKTGSVNLFEDEKDIQSTAQAY